MHWSAVAFRTDDTPAALWIGAVLLYYAALFIGDRAGEDEYDGKEFDTRNRSCKALVSKARLPEMYGHRGSDADVWRLSPYEFHAEWSFERVKYQAIILDK